MIENENSAYQLIIKINKDFQITKVLCTEQNEGSDSNCFHCPECYQTISILIESAEEDESTKDVQFTIIEELLEEPTETIDEYFIKEEKEIEDTLEEPFKAIDPQVLTESHSNLPNFVCEVCDQEFQSQHTFRLHKNIHTDKYYCGICEQGFANNTLLEKHKKRVHTLNFKKKKLDENLVCPKCGKKFGAKVSLRLHMNTHSDKFRCNIKTCLKGFPNNSRLRRHLKGIHGILEANSNKSDTNDQNTNEAEWNDSPIEYEINSDNVSLLPSIIYEDIETIKDRENQTINETEQPSTKKQFVCETCGKIYSSNTAYFIHKQNHKPPQFECNYCGKRVHRKVVLKKHLITQHLKSKVPEFNCNICQKVFCTKYSLIAHARVHQAPKFVCDICFTRFKQSSSLKDHMRIHQGEKPFKCSRCSRSFTTKWALKSHEMIYSGEKNYVCSVCSKAFSRKSYLTAHLKIHQKPFICLEAGCGERFVEVNELQEHKLIHKRLESEISHLSSDSTDEDEVEQDNEMYYEVNM